MTFRPLAVLAAALLSSLALQAQITGNLYYRDNTHTEGHKSNATIIFEANGKSSQAAYRLGAVVNGKNDQCQFIADQGDQTLTLCKGMKVRVQTDGRENDLIIGQDVDDPNNSAITIYMSPTKNGYRITCEITSKLVMPDIPTL